jgi:hypothetical protein
MPGCANAFANRGRIVKMDNRDSDDLILDPRFFNGLLEVHIGQNGHGALRRRDDQRRWMVLIII